MKICFLASASSIHSYRWIKYVADKGHEVDWITLNPPSVDRIENVTLHEIGIYPRHALHIVQVAFKVRALIRAIRPQILHIHYAGTNGLVGMLSGHRPVIVTAWGSDILIAGRGGLTRHLVRFIVRQADLITCDAEHMRQAIVRLGADPGKIRLVYFGTDTHKFRPDEKDVQLREKLGASDAPLIISLRSLEPIYDLPTLIRAVPLVSETHPEAKFVIAGTGSQHQALTELAESLNVSASVNFVGLIRNSELPKYLASADVYVSTSLSDAGLAASTAEAMACGLPVVVTDSAENQLWVKNGESGFLVPTSDPQALAGRIIDLLGSEEARANFGRAGRRVIEERNNYYVEMEKMETMYREMIR
jgi:glycosyltransferase involved in cell wall biosynthesis